MKGDRSMTDLQIEELLYTEVIISTVDYRIDSWFDRASGKKPIDVVNKQTRKDKMKDYARSCYLCIKCYSQL